MENSGTGSGTIPDRIKLQEGKDYYTIADIIKEAQRIYDFNCARTAHKERYNQIKKHLGRKLAGKNAKYISKNRKAYSREIVYWLLNDKLRDYFLNQSVKFNEEDEKEWTQKGRLDKATDAQKRADQARTELQAIKNVSQTRVEYFKNIAALHDSTDEDIEDDIELYIAAEIEKAKHDIFFQFLFDSLIDFQVQRFEDDLRSLPAPEDMNPSDAEVEAMFRLRDLHHYYKPKVDLTALLRGLYKGP